MTKQYKLFKTVKKTANENNLLIAENNLATTKTLFDFSGLDNINLEEWEKDVIKNDALKNVCSFNKESFYGAEYDLFKSCIGRAFYIPHKVYSREGKHLYNVMQFASIIHTHSERNSIYDSWKSVQNEYKTVYSEPLDDLEI